MSLHLVKDNIAVTAIAPGAFVSDMNKNARDHAAEVSSHIPAVRIGNGDDMADVAVYLVSRAGGYVVGLTLGWNGGIARAGVRDFVDCLGWSCGNVCAALDHCSAKIACPIPSEDRLLWGATRRFR